MNNVFRLIGFGLLMLSMSCAISKKENERLEKLISAEPSPSEIITTDSLSLEMLENYKTRAIQKLEDFYDYLGLLINDRYSDEVKEEIKVSALSLFYNKNALINPLDNQYKNTVELFLEDRIYTFDGELVLVKTAIMESLTEKNKNLYEGKMSYSLIFGKKEAPKEIPKILDFSLRKISKKFGDKSVMVWEVYLENIQ